MSVVEDYTLDYEDGARIKQLLMGQRVIEANIDKQELVLSSGVRIKVVPNQGGCACSSGDYELTSLSRVDNIITDVVLVNDPSGDGLTGEGYRIFVFADAEQINLIQIDGDDGNGYYGTGYYLHVTVPEQVVIQEQP